MTETEDIRDRFAELGVEIPLAEIERRMTDLIERFKVPALEAGRSVVSYFLREHDIKREDYYKGGGGNIGGGEAATIDAIDAADKWVNLRVKVVKLWDNDKDSIDQIGLIGDETGTIKFIKWMKSAIDTKLEDGKSYALSNMTTDEWQGRFSVKMNRTTTIEEIEEIEVADRTTQPVTIDSIDKAERWVNLNAKVVELWQNEHESIAQVGLIGDETGTIKFLIWAASNLPPVEEGMSYAFENITTDEYEGRFSVKFNKTSTIEKIDDIEVRETEVELYGVLIAIKDGSGLIRRCPACKHSLTKGNCRVHGNVDGVHDLRIKGVLDDGIVTQDILIGCELTEKLCGFTLDEAKQMAIDALEAEVVIDKMREILVGKYYTLEGGRMDRTVLVKNIVAMDAITSAEIEELQKEAN